MKSIKLASALAFTLTLASCPTDTVQPAGPEHLAVIGVSGAAASRAALPRALDFDTAPISRGHIDAGPPEYLRFTLFRILLIGNFEGGGTVQKIWDSPEGQAVTVDRSGAIDLSGMQDISGLPTGTATGVKLVISPRARMKGSLEARFAGDVAATVHTKAAGAYDALSKTGGAADINAFSAGPAEEIETYFNGGDNLVEQEILCPVDDYVLAAGAAPKLTILFDVSRALRFYDGLGGAGKGPSPSDLDDKAYFFSHSVLTNSIVCYFGDAGSIHGYRTLYDNQNAGATALIPGWATFIFDPAGELQSGLLIGDDDNAGTVLKGLVTSSTSTAGVFDFSYDISEVTVTGFSPPAAVGDSEEVSWTQTSAANGGGAARFTLALKL